MLNNTGELFYETENKNINNSYKIKEEDSLELKEGEDIIIKKNVYLKGKRLVKRKYNIRDNKIVIY